MIRPDEIEVVNLGIGLLLMDEFSKMRTNETRGSEDEVLH